MAYTFSDNISGLKPSAIREIFKVLTDPTVISLAGGNPSPDTFPAKEMAEIASEIFAENPAGALQYGLTEGYPLLRELVSKRLKEKYGIGGPDDDLIIVSGGQQGISLTAKAILNRGDALICEDPSFIGALNAFRSFGVRLVGVPLENDGINIEKLEAALKKEHAKLIYMIPTFQNPAGTTMSFEKRKALLELASKYDAIIIEDNPYFELRYSGEPVPTLKSMDTEGRVVYVGSFSKVLSPGMRIGFVCAPKEIIGKLVVGKQTQDVHTNQMFQMIVAEYLKRYDIDEHIAKDIVPLYRRRRDLMLSVLDAESDGCMSYTRPDGGIFIWCTLPRGTGDEFCKLLGQKKVAAVPGSAFMADESVVCPSFRINYSMVSDEKIKTAVSLLCETAKEYVR